MISKHWLWVAATALIMMCAAPSTAKPLPTDLMGLHPGMTDVDARRRLEKLGEIVRGRDTAKQTWKLRDSRYEYLVIRFDKEWRTHWVTAFAREGGRRVRYREIGSLALAKHAGEHFYNWTIPAQPAGTWTVVARGPDPQYLASISIHPSPMRQDRVVPKKTEAEPTP